MPNKKPPLSRRDFIKFFGMSSLGAIVTPLDQALLASGNTTAMPNRPFGSTGVNVPIPSFGGSLQLPMLMLRNAYLRGVTYWDTASSYMGGNSEKRIGKYFDKYPGDRSNIFLVTKSHAWSTAGMTDDLNRSLERMQTDYIDLFFVHSISNIDEMNEEIKFWAEKTKASGKIRLFGFSTHSNMASCLSGASKLGWIDGIMMTYNYRLMHNDDMKRAVDACAETGIGLTAMKTQGGGQVKTNTDSEIIIAGRFIKKGYTDAQAKLKAVWENPQIASICSEMPNMTILLANIAAAINKTALSNREISLLHQYAHETHSDYCAGCTAICERAINGQVPIGDIMRYLMYSRSYGDRYRGFVSFSKIPENVRSRINRLDYSLAEKRCPQKLAIGKLMADAIQEFS